MAVLGCAALAAVAGLAAPAAGTAANPDFNPSREHHTPDGFRNPDGSQIDKPFSEFLRWRFEQAREGLPKAPAADFVERISAPPDAVRMVRALFASSGEALARPTPVAMEPAAPARATPAALEPVAPAELAASLTWIGHASMALRQEGVAMLIDPVFSDRVSPVSFAGPRRKVALTVALGDFDSVDTVLISHNHYDHLDEPTIRALLGRSPGQPLFIVPLGVDRWLRERGATRVQALDWWDSVRVGAVQVHLVPAQHWSTRTPWDRNQTLWGGFVVESASFRFYYSGDTAYSRPLFERIRARFGGFDLAAIPVGAYAPRWFMSAQHTDPAEAVQAMIDVNARAGLGVHWGSFELADESLDAPLQEVPRALEAAGQPAERLALFRMGETRHYRRAQVELLSTDRRLPAKPQ
jgi:N-acyl-phosphatidylethanolamine-hydrolysing phospholipase D